MPRPVETVQLAALLDKVNRKRTRMYVLLAALAGLRVHEIAKLHGRDVDLVAGSLMVNGKGGRTCLIPLHHAIQTDAVTFPPRGYWFPDYDGGNGHVTPAAVRSAITRAMVRAGVHVHARLSTAPAGRNWAAGAASGLGCAHGE